MKVRQWLGAAEGRRGGGEGRAEAVGTVDVFEFSGKRYAGVHRFPVCYAVGCTPSDHVVLGSVRSQWSTSCLR